MHAADRILVRRFDEGTAVYEIIRVRQTASVRWVDYMYYRYLWSGKSWVKVKYELGEMSFEKLYDTHASGLTQTLSEERIEKYGANALDVPVPSYFKLFYTEVIHPFYLFQIASCIIWLVDEYWIYASCIAVMAIASAIFSVYQARKNRVMLAEMCYSESVVRVLRRRSSSPSSNASSSYASSFASSGKSALAANAETLRFAENFSTAASPLHESGGPDLLYFETIPSREIAPGDLVEIRADTTVPCDLLLVQGQCVVNESALTGESVPVAKVTIPHAESDTFHLDVHGAKHVLFNGTGIVQIRPDVAPAKRGTKSTNKNEPSSSNMDEPQNSELKFSPSFGSVDSSTHLISDMSTSMDAAESAQGEPEYSSLSFLDDGKTKQASEIVYPTTQPLVLGLAIATGFSTAKGDLIRSILFPRPTRFKFYRDSMRFILVLLSIALIGLVYTIIIFTKYGSPIGSMIKRGLDLITITVPPALPIAMSIATAFSVRRLKHESIFCTSPQRINVCGRIDVMCFDKTGTLTEDSLDVFGALPSRATTSTSSLLSVSHMNSSSKKHSKLGGKNSNRSAAATEFAPFVQDLKETPIALLHALACCHSLNMLHGVLIGDPLEIKMFEATRWTLVDAGHVSSEDKLVSLKTLKFFEFSSLLQRMSVVVQEGDLSSESSDGSSAIGTSKTWVYSKGAPEVIKTLCIPSSLPNSFDSELSAYTQQGKRVLALARKRIFAPDGSSDTSSSVQITRVEAEGQLEFLGLFVLQNQLKGDTTTAILNIAGGSVANVMVTGDNEFTAMNVARQCGILSDGSSADDAAVYLISLDYENDVPKGLRYTFIPGIDPEGPDGEARRHTTIDLHFSGSTDEMYDPMLAANLQQQQEEAEFRRASLDYSTQRNGNGSGEMMLDLEMSNSNSNPNYDSMGTSPQTSSGFIAPTASRPNQVFSPAHMMGLSSTSNANSLENSRSQSSARSDARQSALRQSTNSETPLLHTYSSIDSLQHDRLVFAVHGKAFDYIRTHDRKLFARVLRSGRVYARMTPFDKSHLIEGLQTLGHTVGMCGDGANDVGALKAADVGLSLSDAEASVAAPFTSKVPSIRAMWTLLREGRCALASSIACYKYMACYSMIQLITCVLLYSIWWDSRLTDPQFLWIDIFLVFPLSFLMGATKPREELSSRKPPGALVSLSVVGSVVFQTILHFISQLLFFLYLTKSYIPQYHNNWDRHTSTTFRVGALFLFANYEYVGTCLAYSISKPWRKALWTNYLFAISLLLLFAGNVWMTFAPPKWIAKLLKIEPMELWLKFTLLGAAVLEMAVAWCIERFIIIVGIQPYEERNNKLSPLENWADDPKIAYTQ